MSKMGISTYQSYCGAQIFDAVGLQADFVAKYFTGTNASVEGVGLCRNRARDGRAPQATRSATLRCCATRSKSAANTPTASAARRICGAPSRSPTCSMPCAATRRRSTASFAKQINEQSEQLLTLRGMFRIKTAEDDEPQAGAAR